MPRPGATIILTACALLLALASGEAQQVRHPGFGTDAEVVDAQLSLNRLVELPAVSMAELLGFTPTSAARGNLAAAPSRLATPAAGAVSLGRWSSAARGPMADVENAPVIQRRVPDIWQFRVPVQERGSRYLDVDYALHGANGASGTLTNPLDRSSDIRVRIEPLAPTVVAREGDYDVMQGGVIFHLDLSGVRRAGQHSGTLTVSFHNY